MKIHRSSIRIPIRSLGDTRYERERRKWLAKRLREVQAGGGTGTVIVHEQRGVRRVKRVGQKRRVVTCVVCGRGAKHAGGGKCFACYSKGYQAKQAAIALAMPVVPYRYFAAHAYYQSKSRFTEIAARLQEEARAGRRRPPSRRTVLGKLHEEKCRIYGEYLDQAREAGCLIPEHVAFTCRGGTVKTKIGQLPKPTCPSGSDSDSVPF